MLRNRKKNIKKVAMGKPVNSDTIQATLSKWMTTKEASLAEQLKLQWDTLTKREQRKFVKLFGDPFNKLKLTR